MNKEAILLYIFQAILGICTIFIAYVSLKYYRQKPLGMVTLFDQAIEDKIYLSTFSFLCNVILEVLAEYNYTAVSIIVLVKILGTATAWQYSVIFVIRYLSVFHQNVLNNIEDHYVR